MPGKKISLFLGGSKERQDIAVLRAGRSRECPRTSWPLSRRSRERRSLDDERWLEHSHWHDLRGFHRALVAREQRQRDKSCQHNEGTKAQ